MVGATFEREIIRGFFKCQSQIELLPFYLKTEKDSAGSKEPAKPLVISTVVRLISFSKDTEIPRSRPTCCILTPTSETYSGLDFIIEDSVNKQIVFVQTTTRLPHEHEKKNQIFQKLFTSGKIKQILNSLLNAETIETTIDKFGHFTVTLPDSVSKWQVKFLYITSHHINDIAQKSYWKWKDVVVAGRETIKPLNLLFAKEFP